MVQQLISRDEQYYQLKRVLSLFKEESEEPILSNDKELLNAESTVEECTDRYTALLQQLDQQDRELIETLVEALETVGEERSMIGYIAGITDSSSVLERLLNHLHTGKE